MQCSVVNKILHKVTGCDSIVHACQAKTCCNLCTLLLKCNKKTESVALTLVNLYEN